LGTPPQNRQCTHLSFVQAQHYRDALESRAIRKLNHKSEMVRIRLRGLEAFMRWVVNWQIWDGFLLSLVAGFSYPFLLSHWEITRDYAWANLILFAIAMVLLILGLRHAFKPDKGIVSKIFSSLAAALGVLLLVGLLSGLRRLPLAA